jgi:hypothetical protein
MSLGRHTRRWLGGALVLLMLLGALALAAHRLALTRLQAAVLDALGPTASVEAVRIHAGGVELDGLRVRAARDAATRWPAEDELRAERVRLVPQWRAMAEALWDSGGSVWRIASVQVEGAYVSVLRLREGGLRVLPSVMRRHDAAVRSGGPGARAGPPPALAVLIGRLVIADAALDFHDASIARPPHRVQLARLQGELGPLSWPALDRPVPVALNGALVGVATGAGARHGELSVKGTLTPASRDADLAIRLRNVDLRALQPYLLRVNEGGVSRGRLDLTLEASVRAQRLQAPGTVVLTDLALARTGLLSSFAGVPQQLVLAAMEKQGRIELQFTLEGRLDDPAFSLNENLATRVGIGLARALGVRVGGVVEGLGSVIKGLFGR